MCHLRHMVKLPWVCLLLSKRDDRTRCKWLSLGSSILLLVPVSICSLLWGCEDSLLPPAAVGPLFQITSFKPQGLFGTLCWAWSTEGSWMFLFHAGQFNRRMRLFWPLSCHWGHSLCPHSLHPASVCEQDKMAGFCSWVDLGSRHFLCCLCPVPWLFSHYLLTSYRSYKEP